MSESRRYVFAERAAATALEINGFLALALIAAPCWIVGSQVLTWLRDGYWNRRPLNEWLVHNNLYPWTDWAGIQRILDWFLSMPLSLAVALFILCVMAFTSYIGVQLRERADRIWKDEQDVSGR